MTIGQPERATQNRIIALFRDELAYRYLGDKTDLPNNSNIEEALLTAYLTKNDYTPAQISSAIYKLRIEADNPKGTLRVLDLTDAKVRKVVAEAEDVKSLYEGTLASDY